jgi:hypothetical protein
VPAIVLERPGLIFANPPTAPAAKATPRSRSVGLVRAAHFQGERDQALPEEARRTVHDGERERLDGSREGRDDHCADDHRGAILEQAEGCDRARRKHQHEVIGIGMSVFCRGKRDPSALVAACRMKGGKAYHA